MKCIKEFLLLGSILLLVAGCSNSNKIEIEELSESPPLSGGNCIVSTFEYSYLKYLENDYVYFIKGISMDIYEYGRNIKVIEDLKGNFNDKETIFVWGGGHPSEDHGGTFITTGRQDIITKYNEMDTLIIIVQKLLKDHEYTIEKEGDYVTCGCSYSILKLSNDCVTGNITKLHETETKTWKDLQSEWQAFLKSENKPSWWYYYNKWLIPNAFLPHLKYDNYDNAYFIKGKVLETCDNYGKKIELIADLKGNFPEGIKTFTVWGNLNHPEFSEQRFDDLNLYKKGDILLMRMTFNDWDSFMYFNNTYEKAGDFCTHEDGFSVLKLLNNYVSGYITSPFKTNETMLWEEFQELIK